MRTEADGQDNRQGDEEEASLAMMDVSQDEGSVMPENLDELWL